MSGPDYNTQPNLNGPHDDRGQRQLVEEGIGEDTKEKIKARWSKKKHKKEKPFDPDKQGFPKPSF